MLDWDDANGYFTDQFRKRHYPVLAYVPLCSPPVVRCFYISPKSVRPRTGGKWRIFEGASLRVSVASGARTRQACVKAASEDEASGPLGRPKVVKIKGVSYTMVRATGGALGHQWRQETYTTFRKGCCLSLRWRYNQAGVARGSGADRAHRRLQRRVLRTLKSILRSFQLVR